MPHLRATSSGSISLNSMPRPVQAINDEHSGSSKRATRNCQSCNEPLLWKALGSGYVTPFGTLNSGAERNIIRMWFSFFYLCRLGGMDGKGKGREDGSVGEGCPILRQIYARHCIVLISDNNTEQKHNNEERSKTIRNLTMPCINLSEYWTSMKGIAQ